MDFPLTTEQLDLIREELAAGKSPDVVAGYFARVADLEADEEVVVRDAALAIARGEEATSSIADN
jgi:hypothetical protein